MKDYLKIGLITDSIKEKGTTGSDKYVEIGDIDIETKKYLYGGKLSVDGSQIARKNDLLISKVRPTRGAVSIVIEDLICVSNAFLVLRSKENINSKYLFYSIAYNKSFYIYLSKLQRGTSYPSCRDKDILNFQIPLLPLSEQKQIVEILDKADSIRQKRKQSINLLDEYLRSTFLEMFGDPVYNTKKWKSKRLEEICSKITDGKHGDCIDEENSGYYFLSAKDLIDGKLKYTNVRQIKKIDFLEVHKRTNLELYDILLGNTGASIGKVGLVTDEIKTSRTTFQKSISVITVKKQFVLPHFLYSFLLYDRSIFNKTSKGSAMSNLLLSQIRDFNIHIPPILLQNQFAEIVQKVESVKSKMQESLKETDNYFNSLLNKFFNN